MTDIVDENANPSQEAVKEINEGANWLANWITERYNLGYLEKDEYEGAIERLKNTKVYTTGRGTQRFIEALEKGELHLKPMFIWKTSFYYEGPQKHEDGTEVSDQEKALSVLKNLTSNSQTDMAIGFSSPEVEEPFILLNIDLQRRGSEYIDMPSLSSLAVHELTHNLRLERQELFIEFGEFYGKKNFNKAKEKARKNARKKQMKKDEERVVSPEIVLSFVPDKNIAKSERTLSSNKDMSTALSEQKASEIHQIDDADNFNASKILKEGVQPDKYIDSPEEIYARLMQLRYDFGLKPDDEFTDAQIEEIEKRAIRAKKLYEQGENRKKADIDFEIVNRYKFLKNFLNDVALNKEDSKNDLKMQRAVVDYELARVEKMKSNAVEESKDNTHNTPSVTDVLLSGRNDGRG